MQTVFIENANGETAYGRVAARRPKSNEVYVVVTDKPQADGWYPAGMWQEED
jgi:hypothetical protein